jgi:hypothetical protein
MGLLFHRVGDDEAARGYAQQALFRAREVGGRGNIESLALYVLGHALTGLKEWDRAADAYRQSLDIRRGSSGYESRWEEVASLAGLARVALAQGNLSEARAHAEEILSRLETHPSLYGVREPLWVYLTCYRALQASGDPRARQVLTAAHTMLQERAATIDDEATRRSYLENVPYHREIVEAYAREEERS